MAKKKVADIDMGTIFASKGDAGAAPDGQARASTVPPAPPTPKPAEEPAHVTTFKMPAYVQRQIQQRLLEQPGENVRTLILRGLSAIGIHVEDHDLTPQRKGSVGRLRRE